MPGENRNLIPFIPLMKNFKTIFSVNSVVALVLTVTNLRPTLGATAYHFALNLVFAQCIGFSIATLIYTLKLHTIQSRPLRALGLLAGFLVAGWVGMAAGWGINALLFGFSISSEALKDFFTRVSIFNVLAASIVYSYIALQEKARASALRLAEKEVSAQRLQRLKTKAELDALQSKINPHFLFNTLNSIASLIPSRPIEAEQMVQRLSHLLRYTLSVSRQQTIKLQEELDIIAEYLEIEKVRLGDRLSYTISIDPELNEARIPGLLLQPIVENSITHGLANLRRNGVISVHCKQVDGDIQIRLEDNGPGFRSSENGPGFGLAAVRERLSLLYGENYRLDISSKKGVQILLRIPCVTGSPMRETETIANALPHHSN